MSKIMYRSVNVQRFLIIVLKKIIHFSYHVYVIYIYICFIDIRIF